MIASRPQPGYRGRVTTRESDTSLDMTTVALAIGIIAYVPLLRFVYQYDVHPLFNYMGYEWREIGALEHFGLWALAVLPILWMPRQLVRPSQIAYWVLYLFVVIPSILMPPYLRSEVPGGPFALSVMVLLAHGCVSVIYKLKLIRIRAPKIASNRGQFMLGFGVLIAALYVIVISAYGLPTLTPSLDLEEIYEVRLTFGESLGGQSRLVGYAIPWLSEVVNPMLIVWGIRRKSSWFIAAGVLGQLMLFSLTAHKTYLASPLFVPIMLLTLRDRAKHFGLWMVFGSILVLLISVIDMRTLATGLPNTLLVRRMYVAPGLLTARYLEFFSQNPHTYLGHSILRGFVPYPYDDVPARLVGETYFGPHAHANANLWADAFANFGYLGMLMFSGLLAAVFHVFDSVAVRSDLRETVVLMGMPAIALSNTGLLTALLSHGLGLATLIAYVMPRDGGPARLESARGRPRAKPPPESNTRAHKAGEAGRSRPT